MNYSTVSVRLTEEEKKTLEEFAKDRDLTMSQVIRKAVKEYIENHWDENKMTNNYKVFTLKLARKLCELGFKVVGTAPNA